VENDHPTESWFLERCPGTARSEMGQRPRLHAMDDEIEDSRGIDVAQIRRQLRMTVPERVRTMVDAANILTSIRASAQASLSRAE
jgi:hypothetical protein